MSSIGRTCCWPLVICLLVGAASTVGAQTEGVGQATQEQLKQVANVLWGRSPTPAELEDLGQADAALRSTDLIAWFARQRQYEEVLKSLKLVDTGRESQLQQIRHRYGASFYFDLADRVGAKRFAEVQKYLETAREPLIAIMLRENPVVLEDHAVRVLVTEDHLRTYEAAYSFFGEICGASKEEIEVARKTERADTISNFGKTAPEQRSFFARTAAEITAQREGWKIASHELREQYRAKAKEKYKEGGFWAFVPDLNAMQRTAFHQKMIAPDQRIAEFEKFFLVDTEIDWACQLVEVATDEPVSKNERSVLREAMKTDFVKFANGKELNQLASKRESYLKADLLALRSDCRLSATRLMVRSEAENGRLGNFLTMLKRPRPVAEAGPQGWLLTQWHLDAAARWMQMVAWLADAPTPSATEIKAHQNQFVELFNNKRYQFFLDNFPLFVDDALQAWSKATDPQRAALRQKARQLYAQHGLATAAWPLSDLALAEQKRRVQVSLNAFGDKLVQMQIQQMQMQLMFQAHAGIMNAMSESGAIASAGADADIWGGGGSGLMINGEMHQYPVPQTFLAGQYATGASLARSSLDALNKSVALANEKFKYYTLNRELVASGGLAGFDESVLPPLPQPVKNTKKEVAKSPPPQNAPPQNAPPQNGRPDGRTAVAKKDGQVKNPSSVARKRPGSSAKASTRKTAAQETAKVDPLSEIPFASWQQNKLAHPVGVEFVEPSVAAPRRVFEYRIADLEQAASSKLASWGRTEQEKLEYVLSVVAIDAIDSDFSEGVLRGEGINEHGDCSFVALFFDEDASVRILTVPQ